LHRTEADKSSKASYLPGGGVPNPTSWLDAIWLQIDRDSGHPDDEFELVDVNDLFDVDPADEDDVTRYDLLKRSGCCHRQPQNLLILMKKS
jgi:hypothetical protein